MGLPSHPLLLRFIEKVMNRASEYNVTADLSGKDVLMLVDLKCDNIGDMVCWFHTIVKAEDDKVKLGEMSNGTNWQLGLTVRELVTGDKDDVSNSKALKLFESNKDKINEFLVDCECLVGIAIDEINNTKPETPDSELSEFAKGTVYLNDTVDIKRDTEGRFELFGRTIRKFEVPELKLADLT